MNAKKHSQGVRGGEENSQTTLHFQAKTNAQKFCRAWGGDDQTMDNLFTGNLGAAGNVGGAQFRQDVFIGMVLDASLVLSVYEKLKAGTSTLPELAKSGLVLRTSEESTAPVALQEYQKDIDTIRNSQLSIEDKDTKILDVVMDLKDRDLITSHRLLVGKEPWTKYTVARDLAQEMDDHVKPGIDYPQDPRISACKEKVTDCVELLNSGAKTSLSARRKVGKRHGEFSAKGMNTPADGIIIRDVTRMLVIPHTPEVAADFSMVLKHVLGEKSLSEGGELSRVCDEPSEVKKHGLFDKTTYLAVDRLAENNKNQGGRTIGAQGMVGEVRMVSKETLKVEDLTHYVYNFMREVEDSEKYVVSTAKKSEQPQVKLNVTKLKALYDLNKRKFEAERGALGPGFEKYNFPEMLSGRDMKIHSGFKKAASAALSTLLEINIDAVNREPQWAPAFVGAVYYQQAEMNDGNIRGRKSMIRSADLEKVTLPKYVSLEAIKRDAYAQWNADQKLEHEAAQQR